MNEQPSYTPDERWAVATLRRSMVGVEPDAETLLDGVSYRDGRRRHRVVLSLVAAAAVAVLVGLGAIGLSTTRLSSARLAEPAAPPPPTASLTDPTAGPSGSFIDARTAALYLARLTGGNVTDQYGEDAIGDQVEAHLSFDGHTSRIDLVRHGNAANDPVSVSAADVRVMLKTAGRGTNPTPGPDGVFACEGTWLDSCRVTVPGPGQALTTGTAPTANGCCAIRGKEAGLAIYQRADGVVVWVEGRPDMFSTADLVRIAKSPLWDISVPPSPDDAAAAAALTPWAAG